MLKMLFVVLLSSCLNNPVDAVVIDKQYQPKYAELSTVGNHGFPENVATFYPEKFEIKIKYGNIEKTIDNEDLYNKLDKNDVVKVYIINNNILLKEQD